MDSETVRWTDKAWKTPHSGVRRKLSDEAWPEKKPEDARKDITKKALGTQKG